MIFNVLYIPKYLLKIKIKSISYFFLWAINRKAIPIPVDGEKMGDYVTVNVIKMKMEESRQKEFM